MEAGSQFILRFGQVKGDPLAFGQGADKKDQKRDRLNEDKRIMCLGLNNIYQTERAGQHNNRNQRETQCELITDHLGSTADAAQ